MTQAFHCQELQGTLPFNFSKIGGNKVQIQFDDPDVSSDAGALILREVEIVTGIIKTSSDSVIDKRSAAHIKHSLYELIQQRVFQICCGYEDCNDADTLKNDPAFKVATGRQLQDKPLASQPTLSRLDNAFSKPQLMRLAQALGENFLNSFADEPEAIIIDMDPTVNKTYGDQQLTLFNAFADEYCLMPFYVFDGITGQLITTVLRPAVTPRGTEIVTVLKRIVAQIRRRFKKTTLIFRADSHHCRHEVLEYLEEEKVKFIIGLQPNRKLNGIFRRYSDSAKHSADQDMREIRSYHQTRYKAGTWDKEYRVIARVLANSSGTDLRYIVTNMNELSMKSAYEVLYCDRGNAELMIKDSKLGLNSDRMSCNRMQANQFRMLLHGLAYQLMHSLRCNFLKGTQLENKLFSTIRLKLLKVAGRFVSLKKTMKVHLPESSPVKAVYAKIAAITAHLSG